MTHPISKIRELNLHCMLVDSKGGMAHGNLGPFGNPDSSLIDHVVIPPEEALARFSAMCHSNGTKPEVLHNIVNEGITRSEQFLRHIDRTPAV